MSHFFQIFEYIFTGNDNYRIEDNTFSMGTTSLLRDCGSFGCGRNLLQTPLVDTNANILIESSATQTRRSINVQEGGKSREGKKTNRATSCTLLY